MVSGYCWGVVSSFSTSAPSRRASTAPSHMRLSIRGCQTLSMNRPGARRWAIVAVGAAALLSGCSAAVNAGDTPTLTGPIPARPTPLAGPTIRGAAVVGGRAAAGATVIVTTVLQSDEVAGRALKATATLGIGCLDHVGCSSPTSEGRVAQNGRFILAVPKGGHGDDELSVTVLAQRGNVGRVATSVLLPASDRKGADIGSVGPGRIGRHRHLPQQSEPLRGGRRAWASGPARHHHGQGRGHRFR